ncbi:PREDICTED: piggyBac transposable element-derived protein 5-like [Acropora digitifera]|uniref:piggyBac transposable element-derived protein 5-like n=1 Tax=Acropora digitifera TaxID=70779 RepID=UPI00077A2ACF|nr:PREDICTED: piggyBac transposable element-derived protein 5-like [Acropora digitifera]
MASRIVFVHEQNIDEVFSGEDSEQTSDSERSEGEGDRSDEENESEEESEEDNWVVRGIDTQRLNFTGDQGLRVQLPENLSFSDFFHLLFPDNLFDEIKSQTNKYARETIKSLQRRDRLAQTSRFRSWPENGETSGEIKAFLALIVAMGLVNQEDIRDYWSTDEVLSTPFFSQIMSRDKFMNILSFFHLKVLKCLEARIECLH